MWQGEAKSDYWKINIKYPILRQGAVKITCGGAGAVEQ
jgi:hypothetical protein